MKLITQELLHVNNIEKLDRILNEEIEAKEEPVADLSKIETDDLMEVCGLLDEPLE